MAESLKGLSSSRPQSGYRLYPQPEFYSRLTTDIQHARQSVDMHFYIAQKDRTTKPIFTALEDAAVRRNVRVRLFIDKFMVDPIFPKFGLIPTLLEIRKLRRLQKQGFPIEVRTGKDNTESRNPLRRDHKKIAIIDAGTPDAHAYIGSSNLARHFLNWRDYMIAVSPETTKVLSADFEKNWNGKNPSPSRYEVPDPLGSTEILTDNKKTTTILDRTIAEIQHAKHTIWLETTYLDRGRIREELIQAKKRNPSLDMKVLLPHPKTTNDPRFRFFSEFWIRSLAKNGIEIYFFGRKTKQFTHSKVVLSR